MLDDEGAAVLPASISPNDVAMMSPSLISAAPAADFGAVEQLTAPAVEPLTEEAAEGGVRMLGAAPAAGFGGVVLDTGILDSMVTLVDEHGDVRSPSFMGRIHRIHASKS